jgi:ArsR family transcriptional regulator
MTETTTYTDIEIKTARYAKALSHPARVVILRFLETHCSCFAGDISAQLPIADSTVSQHLKVLKEAGLIQGNIHPPAIQYCIRREAWDEARQLFEDFFQPCC